MASTGDRRVRIAIAVLAVVLLALTALNRVASARDRTTTTAAKEAVCRGAADLGRTRGRDITGQGEHVAVIGDSYSTGYGLKDPNDSWPRYLAKPLGARIYVNGFQGTGFTEQAGACRGVSYLDRVEESLRVHPRLVIVEGGLNEVAVRPGHLETAVRSLVGRLPAGRTVIVGPPAAPALAAGARGIDQRLRRICGDLRVQYVSTYSWRLAFLPGEGIHLTTAGHREFGRRVAEAIIRWPTDARLEGTADIVGARGCSSPCATFPH